MQVIKIKNSASTDGLLHFYAPIPFYLPTVILKYQGIVSEENYSIYIEKNPNGIVTDTYLGDRVRGADYSTI